MIARLYISYTMGLLSQFMHTHRDIHWHATLHILAYINMLQGVAYYIRTLVTFAYSDSSYIGDHGDQNIYF